MALPASLFVHSGEEHKRTPLVPDLGPLLRSPELQEIEQELQQKEVEAFALREARDRLILEQRSALNGVLPPEKDPQMAPACIFTTDNESPAAMWDYLKRHALVQEGEASPPLDTTITEWQAAARFEWPGALVPPAERDKWVRGFTVSKDNPEKDKRERDLVRTVLAAFSHTCLKDAEGFPWVPPDRVRQSILLGPVDPNRKRMGTKIQSQRVKADLKAGIMKLWDAGWIGRQHPGRYSEFHCPPHLVAHPHDPTKPRRMTGNMVDINSSTILHNLYEEPADTLPFFVEADTPYVAVLDAQKAYYSMLLTPRSSSKAAFTYDDEQLVWKVSIPGLKNSGAALRNALGADTAGLPNHKLFRDDHVVKGKTFEEFLENLWALLMRMENRRWYMAKVRVGGDTIEVVGRTLTREGRLPSIRQTRTLQTMVRPSTRDGLKSFLGLAVFSKAWVERYAEVCAPLHESIRIRAPQVVDWTETRAGAYGQIIDRIVNAAANAHVSYKLPFEIWSDAGQYGGGATLRQTGEDKVRRIISFWSFTWTEPQLNWTDWKRECYVHMAGLLKYEWIADSGLPIHTYMDNKSGAQHVEASTADPHVTRMMLKVAHLPVIRHWCSRELMKVEDHLAAFACRREELPAEDRQLLEDLDQGYVFGGYDPLQSTVKPSTSSVTALTCAVRVKRPPQTTPVLPTEADYKDPSTLAVPQPGNQDVLRPERGRRAQGVVSDKTIVMRPHAAETMPAPTVANIVQAYQHCPEAQQMLQAVRAQHPDGQGFGVDQHGMLWKKSSNPPVWFVPRPLRQRVIYGAHGHPLGGHYGRDKTFQSLQGLCYWPTMGKDVTQWTAQCEMCNLNKYPKNKNVGDNGLKPLPRRFARVHFDYLGPFPETKRGHKYIGSFVDVCTLIRVLEPTRDADGASFMRAYKEGWRRYYGTPELMVVDAATCFTSQFTEEASRLYGLQIRAVPAHGQEQNGVVEQGNRVIEEQLRIYSKREDRQDWDELTADLQISLNGSYVYARNQTPWALATGQPLRLGLHNFLMEGGEVERPLQEHIQELKASIAVALDIAMKAYIKHSHAAVKRYQETHTIIKYEPGDLVVVSHEPGYAAPVLPAVRVSKKLYANRSGPWVVLRELADEPNNYLLRHLYTETVYEATMRRMKLMKHAWEEAYGADVEEEKKADPLPVSVSAEDKKQKQDEVLWAIPEYIKEVKGTGRTTRFYIKWKGWADDPQYNTWEPLDHVTDHWHIVDAFYKTKPKARAALPAWFKTKWKKYEDGQTAGQVRRSQRRR